MYIFRLIFCLIIDIFVVMGGMLTLYTSDSVYFDSDEPLDQSAILVINIIYLVLHVVLSGYFFQNFIKITESVLESYQNLMVFCLNISMFSTDIMIWILNIGYYTKNRPFLDIVPSIYLVIYALGIVYFIGYLIYVVRKL